MTASRRGRNGAARALPPWAVSIPVRVALAATMAAGVLSGCEREQRMFQDSPPYRPPDASASAPSRVGFVPGPSAAASPGALRDRGAGPDSPPPPGGSHDRNAWATAEGKRWFRWYNCNGCHGSGGGNMGPALMDAHWRYGSEPARIVASILQGRPNGMPSFAGRMPEDQAWQLASYIRSMSGQLTVDVAPSRSDSLSAGAPEQRRDRVPPQPDPPPPPAPEPPSAPASTPPSSPLPTVHRVSTQAGDVAPKGLRP